MRIIFLYLFILGFIFKSPAQDHSANAPILFIYDASGSMWGQLEGKTKKEIAALVLSETVDRLPENQNIGLMAYGHRTEGDCRDVEMLLELNNRSKVKLKEAVSKINPLGRTPLAYSAQLAIDQLRNSKLKATIILITDGIESCDGDICDLVRKASIDGIDFKMHIVGFGLKEGESEQLKCAAEAGGGTYYDAADAGGLAEVLDKATSETIDDPEGNYTIYAVKNGEPVDAWIRIYKEEESVDIDSRRTYRDTANVYIPQGKYRLEIKALEHSDIAPIVITIDKKEGESGHRTVSFDGGLIQVNTSNNGEPWDTVVNIRAAGTTKNVSAGRTYGRTQEYEVNPGIYDVEFSILRVKGLEIKQLIQNVEVMANETTLVEHDFKSASLKIGVKSGDELVDATVNIEEVNSGKSVAGGRTYTSQSSNPKEFLLNPGTYKVTIVTLGKHKGNSETITISIKAGESIEKIFEI